MQYSDNKDEHIQQLENENKNLHEKIALLEHNVELLTQAVLHASKQRFGASTERTPQIEGQCFFLAEQMQEAAAGSNDNVINIKEHKRNIRKKGDTKKVIKALPHEIVECILNSKEAVCDICGSELKVIGKKRVRSEMEYIPAKLVIKDYIEYVYKCTECGKTAENPYDMIVSAPVPAPVPVLTHSMASPSSVAWIIYQKYILSVPLYRQEKDFIRMGAYLRRDTMANWIIRSSEY